MSGLHRVIGFGVVALFALGWIWGLGAKLARRGPGEGYWIWLTAAQVVSQLGDLDTPELRQVRDYERRNANRKTVLAAVEAKLP